MNSARYFLLFLFLVPVCASVAAETAKTVSTKLTKLPDSRNQILKLEEQGISPTELRMKRDDSILFFYNGTKDSLATIEIDYGKKETHCASTNLEILPDGRVRSIKPFVPKDFASVCFHETGTYPVRVYGLGGKKTPFLGSVVVE